jgi:phosphohistidine phosphatase
MPRELLVLRHGKSDWSTDAASDFARPLALRGRKAVKRMGRWLREQRCLPDHIVSSPAKRARQTALRACKFAGISKQLVVWDERIYEAGAPDLLHVLAECPREKKRVMIVGHNPGFEDLVAYLAGDRVEIPPDGKLMPTAALARIEMPDEWGGLEPGCALGLSITRGRDLEAQS